MIAVVDYDTGNLRSVANALQRVGADFTLTANRDLLLKADKVILPGVGEASSAMTKLKERGLDEVIPSLTQPVLGICIGMQLMCIESEEGNAHCMGIFPTVVRRLQATTDIKVPHVGWDTVEQVQTPLFNGIDNGTHFYYVHSFAADLCPHTIAITTYGQPFSAALAHGNFFGAQFHPEKSGKAGTSLIKNFLEL